MASDEVVRQVGAALINDFQRFGQELIRQVTEMKDLLQRIAEAVETLEKYPKRAQ